jgi:ABC-type bacteriocin/lantibiotic exporter with double-glycine peptidase domain
MNIIYYLFSKFFKEEKTNILLLILASFTINILQTNGISYITANIINFMHKRDTIQVWSFFRYFVLISLVFIAIYNMYKHYQIKLLTRLRQWVRGSLVKMLLLINNENFSDTNFANLNAPINRVAAISFFLFNDIITYLLPNFSFLLMVCIFFTYKNWVFGIGFIICNILLGMYCIYNVDDMMNYNNIYEKQIVENEFYLVDLLNNMDKVVSRGQASSEINTYWDKMNMSIDAAYNLFDNINYHGVISVGGLYGIIFGSIAYLIWLCFSGQIGVTIFITFFTILLLYRDKMTILIQQIPNYIEFFGRAESVLAYFKDTHLEYEKIESKRSNSSSSDNEIAFNTIEFKNVTFKYASSENPVIENKNIYIQTNNKIIGITGLSGNGKSTFAKILLKMYHPTSGSVFIDKQNIDDIDTEYIRKNITYVNQSSKLFDKKILDNMFYGCNDRDVCNRLLGEVMKYPKIRDLYRNVDLEDTQTGALGENLSGGQRQIINIISGLINPCKILILDEPTNALDPGLKLELLELIKDFKRYKKCIMIITHDKDVMPLFNERISF